MGGPTQEERATQIASEPRGNFYIGRRYHIVSTRFWGYLRKPGAPWSTAKLVVMNEAKKRNPDRLPEDGPAGQRHGYDQNYEYKIQGYYTGKTVYDPNSDQVLPEFMLTGYELIQRKPGWLFRTTDRYDPRSMTLMP